MDETFDEPYDPAEALRRAEVLRARVRGHGRWYPWQLWLLGAGTVPMAALAGFLRETWQGVLFGTCWAVFVVALRLYARRKPVHAEGTARLHRRAVLVWSALWLVAVLLGVYAFPGRLGYWLPAGVLVASPCLVVAALLARDLRRGRDDQA